MAYTYATVASLPGRAELPAELSKALAGDDANRSCSALENALTQMVSGDQLSGLLMDVIRFVLPKKDKRLKKLLHHYWAAVPKLDEQGKLKQEMILVCNAIRNDLQHPNEYVRGSTLRFLAKIREPDLLEPLVPSVRTCLSHRHAYVRKNAVLCISSFAEHVPDLVPDAVEILAEFLAAETDATCRRNAFVAVAKLDRAQAYAYLFEHYPQMASLDTSLQLAFVDFVRKDAVATPELLPTYLEILKQLLDSADTVAWEAATAVAALTTSPALLAAAAGTFVKLAVHEPDNNVKFVALKRTAALKDRAQGALAPLVMDVLLVLSTPDVGVRREALSLAMSLVTSRTVDQVVRLLKRELAASMGQSYEGADDYRQAIISAIHTCATHFEEVTPSVIGLLLEFLDELNSESSSEVIQFIKEMVELYPAVRESAVQRLVGSLGSIHSSRAFLSALWVVGEYAWDENDIRSAWLGIRKALGPLPLDQTASRDTTPPSDETAEGAEAKPAAKPRVLPDGTYAMESPDDVVEVKADAHPLRRLIVDEKHMFVAGALAATLSKLVIRASAGKKSEHANGMRAEALLAMTSILRLSDNEDVFDRVYQCVQLLVDGTPEAQKEFLVQPHDAYVKLVAHERAAEASAERSELEKTGTAVEQPVQFRLFSKINDDSGALAKLPTAATSSPASAGGSTLKKVQPLTGYSDPVYAEALMTVNQFDIILDVMIFNQTRKTLDNLAVELFTSGDLKVVDVPPAANVAPMSFHTARVTVRVSSTDSAIIFGDIAYGGGHGQEGTVVIINEIRLQVRDYIRPATCTETTFRSMWAEFEWENKVAISARSSSLSQYMRRVVEITNMACLTEAALEENADEAPFLSANLYARTAFGEDILANISAELSADGKVVGHARVRARTQGPAIAVGDYIFETDHDRAEAS